MVPKNREAEIRMELTKEGYPKSGFNYDLFLNKVVLAKLMTKSKLYCISITRAITQSIKILDGVEDAVVTIAMPKEDSFVL